MYTVHYTISGEMGQRSFDSWKEAMTFALRKEHDEAGIDDGIRVWANITLRNLVPAKFANITKEDVEAWRHDPSSVHPNMASVIIGEMNLSAGF